MFKFTLSKKQLIQAVILIILLLTFITYFFLAPTRIFCQISAKQAFPLQIFYSDNVNFTERNSIEIPIATNSSQYSAIISHPFLENIRLDLGTAANNEISIDNVTIVQYRCLKKEIINITYLENGHDLRFQNGKIITTGGDPHFALNLKRVKSSLLPSALVFPIFAEI